MNGQIRKPLVTDLESQLRAIKEQIALVDPADALGPVEIHRELMTADAA